MIKQNPVTGNDVVIYKADQRGVIKNGACEQLCTLNFGSYNDEYRQPFFKLKYFNDVFLPAGKTMTLDEYKEYNLLVLPIIGGVDIRHEDGEEFIGAEQYFWKLQNTTGTITNPFEANDVNFFLIAFDSTNTEAEKTGIINLTEKNKLDHFINFSEQKISMGIYEGRQEDMYIRQGNNFGVFCMAIRGVFEVNGRLLHPRGGVSFGSDKEIEFEALADNSILIIIETV